MNKLYRRWRYLRSVKISHPMSLMRRAIFGNEVDCRTLSRFNGHGLEIGGASRFFQEGKQFPIYSVAEQIDCVNFSQRTFWEGALREGRNFRWNPNKPAGYQFICEASDLWAITDSSYDFLASCHTLEHCANPIKALYEWRRVLKSNGWFALVLPHKDGTFDHRRTVTAFEHLLKDYSDGVLEDDQTHFDEILEKHDLDRDPERESRADFEKWICENMLNRGAHHHVFNAALAIRLVDHIGFEVVVAEVVMPFHIFIVAQKTDKSAVNKENRCRQIVEACCAKSPFSSDRLR